MNSVTLTLRRCDAMTAARAGAASRAALITPLSTSAELWIAPVSDEAVSLGAFQRAASVGDAGAIARRGSGGPAVRVGSGTIHVVLLLAHPSALIACEPSKIVNRYVRPLLRALSKSGAIASYFGRDWISVKHRPAAWVGFAHDASTQRCALEAFVAIDTPFSLGARASYLGKEPGTLASILGTRVDAARVIDSIVDAYAAATGHVSTAAGAWPDVHDGDDDPPRDPPWAATVDEAIGEIGAGPDREGRFRVGGDLLVSRDALRRLEASLASLANLEGAPSPSVVDAIARHVDASLAAPGVAIDGVRALTSVRDAIAMALRLRG